MNPIEILRPDLLVLVLIPVVVLLFRNRFWRQSVEHPLADRFAGFGFQKPPFWLYIPRLIEWVTILLLVGVFIQPVLPIGQRQTTVRALDLVLCIDLSASMRKNVEGPSEAVSASSDPQLTRLEAVKQVVEHGRSIAEVADGVGVNRNLLTRWKSQYASDGVVSAVPGNEKRSELEEENRRLRRELSITRQERDILKKAAAYFANAKN